MSSLTTTKTDATPTYSVAHVESVGPLTHVMLDLTMPFGQHPAAAQIALIEEAAQIAQVAVGTPGRNRPDVETDGDEVTLSFEAR